MILRVFPHLTDSMILKKPHIWMTSVKATTNHSFQQYCCKWRNCILGLTSKRMNLLIPLILDESRASIAPALTVGSCVCQWLCWQLCSPWPQLGLLGGQGLCCHSWTSSFWSWDHRADPEKAGSLSSYPLWAVTQKCPCKLRFCFEGVRSSAVKLAMLFHLQRK